jgi:serine/threonine protein kinase
MLTSGTILQNRYRVLRKIGGGGMGVIYLAKDTRLSGRHCAIKEVSPAQLPPQDRNWAINAFRQEAQILAQLSHPGLTAINDFFPEKGNWYLVMDYVNGETLRERMNRSGGRLPLQEALKITRKLCSVLNYLHNQQPPVVFRDLKPDNVMLTPNGEVKLIDFGIARFFKPGKTRDTVNLGTPGYAAPEQYGGRGQSDPRADVYSLGVLLHQMVTGYDPTTASTPFPLPPVDNLMRNLPPHVEDAVSRAVLVNPDHRFQSVSDFQTALFPSTQALPRQPQRQSYPGSPADHTPGPGKKVWIALGGAVLLIGACAAMLGGALALSSGFDVESASTVERTATSRPTIMPTHTKAAPNTQPTSTPWATTDSSQGETLQWSSIGESVQGRDIKVGIIGAPKGTAIVVIGNIQGNQVNTLDLVNSLADDFDEDPDSIPSNVTFHFIPTINPDGAEYKTRRNANDVDLNRNWDTFDWTADPEQPEGTVRSAGGSHPHSEPETQALADYLRKQLQQNSDTRVVLWHASQRLGRNEGHVYPGYTADGLDEESHNLAQRYKDVTGYTVKGDWEAYDTTGELIAWCAEEDIAAIDIVISRSLPGDNRTLRERTKKALLEIAQLP